MNVNRRKFLEQSLKGAFVASVLGAVPAIADDHVDNYASCTNCLHDAVECELARDNEIEETYIDNILQYVCECYEDSECVQEFDEVRKMLAGRMQGTYHVHNVYDLMYDLLCAVGRLEA